MKLQYSSNINNQRIIEELISTNKLKFNNSSNLREKNETEIYFRSDNNIKIEKIKINQIDFHEEQKWFRDTLQYKRKILKVSYDFFNQNKKQSYEFTIRPDLLVLNRNKKEILLKILSSILAGKPIGKTFKIQQKTRKNSSILISKKNYLANLAKKIDEKFFHKTQWQVQVKFSEQEEWITIAPPKDRFWADPFLLEKDGKYFLFVEELIYSKGFAHLSVLEINKQGEVLNNQLILDKGHHLSYPYIFEEAGKFYMIPETAKSKTIEIYEAKNFPYNWELKEILMDNILASDTSVIKKGGKWWLFTSEKHSEQDSYDSYLSIYSSENLIDGKWLAHKNNPVKVDVRDARCGGYLYFENNELYRVSQNCSKCYGYGYNRHKVVELTDEKFEEKTIESITADDLAKNIAATHTFSKSNNLVCRDILVKRKFLR